LRHLLEAVGEKLVPFLARQLFFELLWSLQTQARNPFFRFVQNEIDRLQGARSLLREGGAEVLDFLRAGFDRVAAEILDRQPRSGTDHDHDRDGDQHKPAVGLAFGIRACDKPHQQNSL